MTTTKDDVKRQFGANAEKYASSTTHAQGSDLQIVLSTLNPQPHMRVLDVATGAGHTAAIVAPHVEHVTATDLTAEMVAQTQKLLESKGLANTHVQVADVENLPFDNAAFDAVTCRIAAHHFLDVEKAVGQIARVLKADGVFVLEDSFCPQAKSLDRWVNALEKLRDPTHVRAYTKREWRRMLIAAGFQVANTEDYRKTHDVEQWMTNSGCSEELKTAVRDTFINAPQAAKEHYELTFNDGKPVTYTDDKVIIKAVKR